MRLNESLYNVKSFGEDDAHLDQMNRLAGFSGSENSCLPVGTRGAKQSEMLEKQHLSCSGGDSNRSNDCMLSGHSLYVDLDISPELRKKVKSNNSGEQTCYVLKNL